MSDATTKRYALLILVMFLAVAVGLTYMAFVFPNIMRISDFQITGSGNSELVNLPRIESSVTSSEDGSVHDISVDFTLAVNEHIKAALDTKTVETKISAVLKDLDYAKINDVGGMDYIKTEVIRELESYINLEDFRGLYIRDIRRASSKFDYFDMPNSVQTETTDRPRVSEIIEGLRTR